MAVYNIGDKVTITGKFTSSGYAADPISIVVKYKDPSGEITELFYGVDNELVKVDTGVYTFDISLSKAGQWYYYMSDNSENVSREGHLTVLRSNF